MGWEELEAGDKAIDIGNGVKYTKSMYEGVWVGIIEWHLHPITGELCGGFVPFDVDCQATSGREKWTVHSLEPLTLSPSLQCTMDGCGHHGFITDGRWVPA